MLKNDILQLLDDNKEGIKVSFKIKEEEIGKIREFLIKDHENFRTVIDNLSESNISDRGKMVICCLIGYANGNVGSKLFKLKKLILEKK